MKSCSALENVTLQELLVCVIAVPERPHFQEYVLKSLSSLVQCTSVAEFIDTLCHVYSNFIFYHLFEKVVTTYGNKTLRDDMERYKDKLTSIITIAKAAEYVLCATNLKSTTEMSTEIVISIHVPFLDCTIGDIERVRREIQKISYSFEWCHNIVAINGDSTTTTTKWSFPQPFCRHLQVDVLLSSIPFKYIMGNVSVSALELCGVMKMDVDGLCVFEYDPHNKEVGTN